MKEPKNEPGLGRTALVLGGAGSLLAAYIVIGFFVAKWLRNLMDGPAFWLAIGTITGLILGVVNVALLIKKIFWGSKMDNMTPVINIVTRVTVIIMAGLVMGWALHHETRAVTLGMALGLLAGLVNFRYLALKVRRVTAAVAKQGKSSFSLGFCYKNQFCNSGYHVFQSNMSISRWRQRLSACSSPSFWLFPWGYI
ncbi:ATP synthase subunit I [Paenibacillus rhizoplanae]